LLTIGQPFIIDNHRVSAEFSVRCTHHVQSLSESLRRKAAAGKNRHRGLA
jgi:hypothetical protein